MDLFRKFYYARVFSAMLKKTSTITVPNDQGYVTVVLAYCGELARKAGFTEKEISGISTALREACENVLTHAFDPYDDESFSVTFDVEEDGLRITIDEMGMPFPARLENEGSSVTPGINAMEENMDSVLFVNRGREGKELVLFKYRKGKHIEDIFTAEELKPYEYCEIPAKDIDYTLRLMKPEEAVQVSRCIFRAYRYTYLNEDLYFPERIAARNRDGRMISAVAVLGDEDGGAARENSGNHGEVIAHFALMPRPNNRVAEIGVAVVRPRFRGRGLMKKLLDYLIRVAGEKGFTALYGNAFTMHDLSQKTNLRFGFSETALQLGCIPPSSIQPLCERSLRGAGCVMTFFNYLRGAERYRVYLPARHKAMLEETYEGLGVVRIFDEPGAPASSMPEESALELSIKPNHRIAVITVNTAGKDLDRRLKAKRMELADKGFNSIFLDLDLTDPCTPEAAGMAESTGFFYSGLLPDYGKGDVLRLQYYLTEIIYDEIVTFSPFAKELKSYVRSLDPKWKALH